MGIAPEHVLSEPGHWQDFTCAYAAREPPLALHPSSARVGRRWNGFVRGTKTAASRDASTRRKLASDAH